MPGTEQAAWVDVEVSEVREGASPARRSTPVVGSSTVLPGCK